MTQVVNRPKRATTKVSISNSLISITPSYVLSCQSRGIVTGSSVFLGKTSRLPFFSGRRVAAWDGKIPPQRAFRDFNRSPFPQVCGTCLPLWGRCPAGAERANRKTKQEKAPRQRIA